jgi:hypothetical protein
MPDHPVATRHRPPGIHWHAGCQRGSDTGSSYAAVLESLRAVLQTAQLCRAKHPPPSSSRGPHHHEEEEQQDLAAETRRERDARGARRQWPLLLWRETLPQHFPSSNGGYPLGQKFVGERRQCSTQTAPMPSLMCGSCPCVMWSVWSRGFTGTGPGPEAQLRPTDPGARRRGRAARLRHLQPQVSPSRPASQQSAS